MPRGQRYGIAISLLTVLKALVVQGYLLGIPNIRHGPHFGSCIAMLAQLSRQHPGIPGQL